MKIPKIILFMLLVLPSAALSQTLPRAEVQDASGRSMRTESWIDGKTPFVVSFWGSTCKPCIQELDTMSENYEEWSAATPFRVIAVAVDDSRSVARARSLAAGRGWSDFTLAFDVNSDLKRALNITSVPRVFLYDRNGRLVYTHTGYKPGDEYELLRAVRKLSSGK